jgi:hypothetical protein
MNHEVHADGDRDVRLGMVCAGGREQSAWVPRRRRRRLQSVLARVVARLHAAAARAARPAHAARAAYASHASHAACAALATLAARLPPAHAYW